MKKTIFKTFILAAFLAFSFSANAVKEYTQADIENYLSNLNDFSARFEQIIPGENFSKGMVYIKKPGRFLWQYEFPQKARIVSNGGLIYFEDQETDQLTQIPASGFLFSLLGSSNIRFDKKGMMLQDFIQTARRVTVNLIVTIDGNKAPLTLIFRKLTNGKINLIKIITVNQLEQTVVVSLFDQNDNANIDPKIFKIVDLVDEEYAN